VKIGSLFSGIGGLELGLERAGCGRTVWQCEIDPYARAVLAKHWPDAIRFDDITKMHDVPQVDLICGGFPCQDISNAGKRVGIDGARSGLFFELMRVVRLVRPRFVVLENVAALLGRGMGDVLGELSESGYDAEWDCVPASSVGAPHRRDRVFIVGTQRADADQERRATDAEYGAELARADDSRDRGASDSDSDVADANVERRERWIGGAQTEGRNIRESVAMSRGEAGDVADAESGPTGSGLDICERQSDARESRWYVRGEWLPEPPVGRVAHGIPSRVDRLKCLGNAVVPAVAEVVGRLVMQIARAAS
jgi:DNA (cytosine-5)-methyltransferase 1